LFTSIALSARAYLDPVQSVPRAVEQRRWVVPLLWLMLTGTASAVAFANRLDASAVVLPRMEAAGELGKASEREVAEEIEQTQRIALVAGVAKATFGMPLAVLAIAVALKFVSWLLGKKALFGACFTSAAMAMLPVALFFLLSAAIALRQDVVVPEQQLIASSVGQFFGSEAPGLSRALNAIDFFNLWAAALLGLGFAAATRMSVWRAVGVCLFLYALFAAAVMVGLPGVMGGMR
jgi:hypothetical protein